MCNNEELKKSKRKGFHSVHPSFHKMILSALSTDATNAATDPAKACTDFFDQRSAVHAKIHLLQTMTHTYHCCVKITIPIATALYHGNFLWNKLDIPNNFCSFLFPKPSPLSPTSAKEAMILHLKAEKGGGWSDKDLKKNNCTKPSPSPQTLAG